MVVGNAEPTHFMGMMEKDEIDVSSDWWLNFGVFFDWWLDFGTSCYLCENENLLNNTVYVSDTVTIANDESAQVTHKGITNLKLSTDPSCWSFV